MLDWIIDNWPTILAVLALLERTGAMSSRMMRRVRLLTRVIGSQHNMATGNDAVIPTAKEMMPDDAHGDMVIDSALDRDDPHYTDSPRADGGRPRRPRVNRRRKLGRLLLDIVPLVSRVVDRRNGLDRTV